MKQVLVIEDDPQTLKLIKCILEGAGYATSLASDGMEGLQQYHRQPVDLVITDLIMPNKEGLETIMALKEESRSVKIIAISGGGRIDPDDYLYTARLAGAQRTFSKPFAADELLQAVKDLIGKA